MLKYNNEILEKLKAAPFQRQGMVGDIPSLWAEEMRIEHQYKLPNTSLSREEVHNISKNQDTPLLKAYLIIMAWGAQGRGPGGRKYVMQAWSERSKLEKYIEEIRLGELTREQEYNLFCGEGEISGLGPAYFTKLLYFFSPNRDRYIMDQWTTKPIILLTGKNLIRHSNQGPTRKNTGKNYELFCQVIDNLVYEINATSGDEVEQRLFSVGSIRRQPRGEFRQFIVERWKNRPKLPRYSSSIVDNLLYK